ncbi:MAG TPA: bifunctional protein-serine/threonine kinase/phosphatase [Methylophilaceae bacterium]|nr:bifunctional protein-serine/threonine kinase/phosphatase [Methylophilaceae bacterium]
MLRLTIGERSDQGPRERNEDFYGVVTPENEQLVAKGALLAVADGVSGHSGGREAAEMSVRSLLSDYYATPDTWEVTVALDKVLGAVNRWVLAQAAKQREMAGMATTLSALVLRGRRYTLAHVGDSRVYRLRDGALQLLTTDHVWDREDMRHVLKRAIGLDRQLTVDYAEGELQVGDVFALVTDGVWERLGTARIQKILALYQNPQLAADDLVKSALAEGSEDNATALVTRVEQVGEENFADLLAGAKTLGLPPRLKPGERLDDFEVLDLLHESRASLIYKARHVETQQLCVIKTLQPLLAHDMESCTGLLNEEWLAKRVVAHFFPQVLPIPMERRSCLYYVMSFHAGATLQKQLDSGVHFTAADVAGIGIRLVKGLAVLHRLNIVHRDIKPANVHMGEDGRLRILDLGVSLNAGMSTTSKGGSNPGTPSYMAPELFDGESATVQTDLYAVGVTLYHLLTRKYPYGEIEPFQHPRFGDPVAPTRYRPEIPQWLENIVLKAVTADPARRFETAEEMLLALELGEARPILAPGRTPIAERRVSGGWQLVAMLSVLVNILLIYLLIIS